MSPPISEQDIIRTCGRTYSERGRACQRAGKVHGVAWDAKEQTLIGTVAGSGRNVYQQEILVNSINGRLRLEGYCTCPMEEDCKHVAAVLFEWLSRNGKAQPVAASRPKPLFKAPTPLEAWRQQVAAQLAKPASPASPASGRQVLLFLLAAQPSQQGTDFTLTFLKSRPLQRGGWGKPTPLHWSQLTGSSSYSYGFSPDWLDPLDREIVELVRKYLTSISNPRIAGVGGPLRRGDPGPLRALRKRC